MIYIAPISRIESEALASLAWQPWNCEPFAVIPAAGMGLQQNNTIHLNVTTTQQYNTIQEMQCNAMKKNIKPRIVI